VTHVPAEILLLIGAVVRYEEDHGPHEEWTCFRPLLNEVDLAVRLEAMTWFAVDEKYRQKPPVEGWLPSVPPAGYPSAQVEWFDWFRSPEGAIMGVPKGVVFRGGAV
jgi:hypothetical protein